MLPVTVMMNNYFHDVATALLFASAVVMLVLLRALDTDPRPDAVAFLVRVYPKLTFLPKLALVWIVLGGIPRMIFFQRLEWWDAAEKGVIPALAVKHALMFTLVVLGAWKWFQLKRRIGDLAQRPVDGGQGAGTAAG